MQDPQYESDGVNIGVTENNYAQKVEEVLTHMSDLGMSELPSKIDMNSMTTNDKVALVSHLYRLVGSYTQLSADKATMGEKINDVLQSHSRLESKNSALTSEIKQLERAAWELEGRKRKVEEEATHKDKKLRGAIHRLEKANIALQHKDSQYKHQIRKNELEFRKLQDSLTKFLQRGGHGSKQASKSVTITPVETKKAAPSKAEAVLLRKSLEAAQTRLDLLVNENTMLRGSLGAYQASIVAALFDEHQNDNNADVDAPMSPVKQFLSSLPVDVQDALKAFAVAQMDAPFESVEIAVKGAINAHASLLTAVSNIAVTAQEDFATLKARMHAENRVINSKKTTSKNEVVVDTAVENAPRKALKKKDENVVVVKNAAGLSKQSSLHEVKQKMKLKGLQDQLTTALQENKALLVQLETAQNAAQVAEEASAGDVMPSVSAMEAVEAELASVQRDHAEIVFKLTSEFEAKIEALNVELKTQANAQKRDASMADSESNAMQTLMAEKNALSTQLSSVAAQLAEFDKECNNLRTEISEKTVEFNKLQESYATKSKALVTAQETVTGYEAKILALNKHIEQMTSSNQEASAGYEKIIEEQSAQISHLERLVANSSHDESSTQKKLAGQLQQAKAEYDKLIKKKDMELKSKTSHLVREFNTLKATHDATLLTVDQHVTELATLQQTLLKERHSHQEALVEVTAEMASTQTQLASVTSQLRDIELAKKNSDLIMSDVTSEMTKLQSKNVELKSKLNDLTEEHATLIQTHNVSETQLAMITDSLKILEKECQTAKAKNEEYASEIAMLTKTQNTNVEKANQIEMELAASVHKLETALASSNVTLTNLQVQVVEMEQALTEKDAQISLMEATKSKLNDEMTAMNAKMMAAERESKNIQIAKQALEEQVHQLSTKSSTTDAEFTQQITELSMAKNQLQSALSASEQMMKTEQDNHVKAIKQARQELEGAQEKLSETETLVFKMKQEKAVLDVSMIELQGELEQVKKEKKNIQIKIQSDMKAYEASLTQLKNDKLALSTQMTNFNEYKSASEAKITELTSSKSTLERSVQSLTVELEAKATAYDNVNNMVSQLRKDNALLKASLDETRRALEVASVGGSKASENMAKMQTEISKLKEEVKAAELQHGQDAKDIASARVALNNANINTQSLTSELGVAAKENETLENTIASHSTTIAGLNAELSQVKETLANVQANKAQLQREVTKFEVAAVRNKEEQNVASEKILQKNMTLLADLESAKAHIASLTREQAELQSSIANAHKTVDRLTAEKASLMTMSERSTANMTTFSTKASEANAKVFTLQQQVTELVHEQANVSALLNVSPDKIMHAVEKLVTDSNQSKTSYAKHEMQLKSQLNATITRMTQENAVKDSEIARLKAKLEQVTSTQRNEQSQLASQTDGLVTQVAHLQEIITESMAELYEVKEKNKLLEAQLSNGDSQKAVALQEQLSTKTRALEELAVSQDKMAQEMMEAQEAEKVAMRQVKSLQLQLKEKKNMVAKNSSSSNNTQVMNLKAGIDDDLQLIQQMQGKATKGDMKASLTAAKKLEGSVNGLDRNVERTAADNKLLGYLCKTLVKTNYRLEKDLDSILKGVKKRDSLGPEELKQLNAQFKRKNSQPQIVSKPSLEQKVTELANAAEVNERLVERFQHIVKVLESEVQAKDSRIADLMQASFK